MSQSVTLLSPTGVSAEAFVRGAGFSNFKSLSPDDRPSVQVSGDGAGGSWYFSVEVAVDSDKFLEEYESNDDLEDEFRALVPTLHPLLVHFNRIEPVREAVVRFLQAQAEDARSFWMDTDYGWVIRGDHLLEKCADEEGWDWRYEPES